MGWLREQYDKKKTTKAKEFFTDLKYVIGDMKLMDRMDKLDKAMTKSLMGEGKKIELFPKLGEEDGDKKRTEHLADKDLQTTSSSTDR